MVDKVDSDGTVGSDVPASIFITSTQLLHGEDSVSCKKVPGRK